MRTEGVQVVCDKCGKAEFYNSYIELNESKWKRIAFDGTGIDFCPDCSNLVDKYLQHFLQKFEGFE